MSIILEVGNTFIKKSVKKCAENFIVKQYDVTSSYTVETQSKPFLMLKSPSFYLPVTVLGLSWHPRKRRVQTSKVVMKFTGITQ